MEDPELLGARIREARTALRMTQADLGDATGRSANNISKWEAGLHAPKPTELVALARALSVSAGWLLGGTDDVLETSITPTHRMDRSGQLDSLRLERDLPIVVEAACPIPRLGWDAFDRVSFRRGGGPPHHGAIVLVTHQNGMSEVREVDLSIPGIVQLLSVDGVAPPIILREEFSKIEARAYLRHTELLNPHCRALARIQEEEDGEAPI